MQVSETGATAGDTTVQEVHVSGMVGAMGVHEPLQPCKSQGRLLVHAPLSVGLPDGLIESRHLNRTLNRIQAAALQRLHLQLDPRIPIEAASAAAYGWSRCKRLRHRAGNRK